MKDPNETLWSPYLAGTLAGLVMLLSIGISGKYFGASTTFVRSAGMLEKIFNVRQVEQMDYFIEVVPKIDWQWMFAVGIFIGSFIASIFSRSFRWKALPDMWERRFGSSHLKRGAVAFLGGVIAMFGARLADG